MTKDALQRIEKAYPPDELWGVFGTSPAQIEKALKDHHLPHLKKYGREELQKVLRGKGTAICLVQNEKGLAGLIEKGAHWFVVYGYDDKGVYVTNYHSHFIDWPTFETMWKGIAPRAVGMSEAFYWSPYGPHGRSDQHHNVSE